jgi:hypothetical protein
MKANDLALNGRNVSLCFFLSCFAIFGAVGLLCCISFSIPFSSARHGHGPGQAIIKETEPMAKEPVSKVPLERATKAKTTTAEVMLSDLVSTPEQYCHRDDQDLNPSALESLRESLIREGLQIPLEVVLKGVKYVVVKGHRRHACLQHLAAQETPGFSSKMKIPVIVVEGATEEDLLLRSVLDNAVRRDFTQAERVLIVRKFHNAGVSSERGASALGVSKKTYDRDLVLARYDWMFQHFVADNISHTDAIPLLEAAQKGNRMDEFKEVFETWVEKQKLWIAEKNAQKKTQTGKKLTTARRQVKTYLTPALFEYWRTCLREGAEFGEVPSWSFSAGLERESMTLHIDPVNLNVGKTPLDNLVKLVAQLSKATKDVLPIIKQRYTLETAKGAQAHDDTEPYDFSVFAEEGMDDIARNLTPELFDDTEALDDHASDEDPSVA